ncbi:hypothetical protein BD779DRAFT_1483052 [Infundibulicybe gibba]|nr:hypothetical protein BD779DRAFT_1483052 [Infundibulicybe gibba]
MPPNTCYNSQCNSARRYSDRGRGFCCFDCQLRVISQDIPFYVPIQQIPRQDHRVIQDNMHGASIAGFGAPIQELKSLVVFLQASSQNWNHYRVERLRRVNCMAAINHFGPTENGPTGVELTSSVVVIVGCERRIKRYADSGAVLDDCCLKRSSLGRGFHILHESVSTRCQSHHPLSRTIAARGSWSGEIDLKRIFRWNPIFKPNGITIWLRHWPSWRCMKPEETGSMRCAIGWTHGTVQSAGGGWRSGCQGMYLWNRPSRSARICTTKPHNHLRPIRATVDNVALVVQCLAFMFTIQAWARTCYIISHAAGRILGCNRPGRGVMGLSCEAPNAFLLNTASGAGEVGLVGICPQPWVTASCVPTRECIRPESIDSIVWPSKTGRESTSDYSGRDPRISLTGFKGQLTQPMPMLIAMIHCNIFENSMARSYIQSPIWHSNVVTVYDDMWAFRAVTVYDDMQAPTPTVMSGMVTSVRGSDRELSHGLPSKSNEESPRRREHYMSATKIEVQQNGDRSQAVHRISPGNKSVRPPSSAREHRCTGEASTTDLWEHPRQSGATCATGYSRGTEGSSANTSGQRK